MTMFLWSISHLHLAERGIAHLVVDTMKLYKDNTNSSYFLTSTVPAKIWYEGLQYTMMLQKKINK